MNEQASQSVVALATLLIDALQRVAPGWQRAFLRIDVEEGATGAKCTYVNQSGVHFLGSIEHSAVYAKAIDLGEQLLAQTRTTERAFKVCLVMVDAHFNYEVKFEYEDPEKWAMSKMNGGSGMPVGITEADLAALGGGALGAHKPRPWYKFW